MSANSRSKPVNVDDLLEQLVEPGRTALARRAEDDRARALNNGEVEGITRPNGIAINALVFVSTHQWLDGLFELRKALHAGLDRQLGHEIMRLIIDGLDVAVEVDLEVREDFFSSSSLALLRIVEVMLRGRDVSLAGRELEVVFGRHGLMYGLMTLLHERKTRSTLARSNAARSALEGNLRGACATIGAAYRDGTATEQTSVDAEFTWIMLSAAVARRANYGTQRPRVKELRLVLQLALDHEVASALHSTSVKAKRDELVLATFDASCG